MQYVATTVGVTSTSDFNSSFRLNKGNEPKVKHCTCTQYKQTALRLSLQLSTERRGLESVSPTNPALHDMIGL